MPTSPLPEPREAGRELDALIAEKVMGYEWRRANTSHGAKLKWLLGPQQREDFTWGNDPLQGDEKPSSDFARNVPKFSTDIAAAWTLVERLLALGYWPDLISSHRSDGRNWRCEIDRYTPPDAETDPFPVTAVSESAPHAICLAALAALTSEDPAHV